jgi:hypothetical protein
MYRLLFNLLLTEISDTLWLDKLIVCVHLGQDSVLATLGSSQLGAVIARPGLSASHSELKIAIVPYAHFRRYLADRNELASAGALKRGAFSIPCDLEIVQGMVIIYGILRRGLPRKCRNRDHTLMSVLLS